MQKQVYIIQNVVDDWKEDMQDIEEAFVQYYEGFLGTDDSIEYQVSDSIVKQGPILSSEYQLRLYAPFTKVGVKQVVFDIHDNKATRPDGYSSAFLKQA